MDKIRILLADDQTLFRESISRLLASESDLEVVGEAGNAGDAVAKVSQTFPDIVLMEACLPGLSCFEATRLIRRDHPKTKMVVLSIYDDEDHLSEAMQSGASGYVLKNSPVEQRLAALREVHRGGNYLSPRLLSHLVNDFRTRARNNSPIPRFDLLTAREREVLKLLAEGNSVKEIAADLRLSLKTVETHKFNLMRKLDIHNKARLVQYAIQKKIIRLAETA